MVMKPQKIDSKRIEEIVETYTMLINGIEDSDVRSQLTTLMDKIGDRFFTAPASNRLNYHNCFTGGLAEHSLRVYGNLRKLRDLFAPNISDRSITICALFHDLGKVGSLDEDYFLPQESQWHRDRGEYYIHNDKLNPYMDVSFRSVKILMDFGIFLTDEEVQAIYISDGQYVDKNKSYQHKETWLGLLLHQADMIACKMEQDKWKSIQ